MFLLKRYRGRAAVAEVTTFPDLESARAAFDKAIIEAPEDVWMVKDEKNKLWAGNGPGGFVYNNPGL